MFIYVFLRKYNTCFYSVYSFLFLNVLFFFHQSFIAIVLHYTVGVFSFRQEIINFAMIIEV